MKKIIPSKPPTQNTTPYTPDPFGYTPVNPFGRLTVEQPSGESGIQTSMNAEADRLHPTSGMRRKTRGMA